MLTIGLLGVGRVSSDCEQIWSDLGPAGRRLAGFLFTFFVPGRDVPPQVAAMFLQADGRWTIRRSKIEDIEFLYKNVISMGEAMRRKKQ